MSKKPKYPWSLFFFGFAMNLIKHFYLLAPSIILLIIGFFSKWSLIFGSALLILDVVISLVEQFQIRHAALHNDSPEFKEWQDALLSENWRENVHSLIEGKLNGEADFVNFVSKELLQNCKKILDSLTDAILSYYRDKDSSFFNGISKSDEGIDSVINDIIKIVIPDLEYIKETIEKDYILNKRKIEYANLINDKWSKDSELYIDLISLYKGIPD